MIAFIDSLGKFTSATGFGQGQEAINNITRVPDGTTPIYIDEELYPEVVTNMGEYTYNLETGFIIHSPIPDSVKIEGLKPIKLAEINEVCKQTIYNGVDVTTSQGIEHFSLKEEDQTNLLGLANLAKSGELIILYHADGKLCRFFTAEEILTIFQTSMNFKVYNTTYCNHLHVWIERCDNFEELSGIQYGVTLPDDLLANMNTLLRIG